MVFGQHAEQMVDQLDSTRFCFLPEHKKRPRDLIIGFLQQHLQEHGKLMYQHQIERQSMTYQDMLSQLTEFGDNVLEFKRAYPGNHPDEIAPLLIDRIRGYQPSYFYSDDDDLY